MDNFQYAYVLMFRNFVVDRSDGTNNLLVTKSRFVWLA